MANTNKNQKNITYTKQELHEIYRRLNHDLIRDIGNISGLINIFAKEYEDVLDEDFKEHLNHITSCCDRLSETTEFGNSLYRLHADKVDITENSLGPIIEVIKSENLVDLINKREAIVTFPEVRFEFDKNLMLQACEEIIKNGIIYNKSEVPKVDITVEKHSGSIKILFSDNGVGFSENFTHNSGFFLKNESGLNLKARGAGLSKVKKILELHNASFFIYKNENLGSVVEWRFPAIK